MADFTYGETKIVIPPYKIRELRAAAPYITKALRAAEKMKEIAPVPEDIENVEAATGSLVETMFEGMGDILAVLAIGVIKHRLLGEERYTGPNKEQRPYSVEAIESVLEDISSELNVTQMAGLNGTFNQILTEAGMVKNVPLVKTVEDEKT